jgi:hypothetical protein
MKMFVLEYLRALPREPRRTVPEDRTVLDLFGSKDGEGLAWCRALWAEDKRILLIHGANVDLNSSFDSVAVDELTLSHFDNYDVFISSPLYSSPSSARRRITILTARAL